MCFGYETILNLNNGLHMVAIVFGDGGTGGGGSIINTFKAHSLSIQQFIILHIDICFQPPTNEFSI